MYWAERMDQGIYRANLDGSYAFRILACWDGVGHPRGLALTSSRIYWSTDESILSATLDGEDVQTVISDLPDAPWSLELDSAAGKLYWVTGSFYAGLVQRMNLDGSGLETLVEGLYASYGIALEFGGGVPAPEIVRPIVRLENYPNPFNPHTTLAYRLPSESHVRLDVYDLRGGRVRTIVDGVQAAGEQRMVWDGRDELGRHLTSGLYFARLVAGEVVVERKLLLTK
jgi:hypothetical protein